MRSNIQRKKNRSGKHKKFILVASIAVAIALGIVVLELTNKTYLFHDRKAVSGPIHSNAPPDITTSPSSEKNPDVPPSDTKPPENPKEGDTPTPSTPTGAAPLAPYGNFVSNHRPSLGNKPEQRSIESVCNTTPGARCHIEFTNKDNVVKTLEARTADSSGTVYWNWDVKQAGLTLGTWRIKVIAELNNQTKTTENAQNLEVQP